MAQWGNEDRGAETRQPPLQQLTLWGKGDKRGGDPTAAAAAVVAAAAAAAAIMGGRTTSS